MKGEMYRSYVRLFLRSSGRQAFLTLGVDATASLLGGINLLMLVPLLYIVNPSDELPTGSFAAIVERVFAAIDLALTLEAVLLAFVLILAVRAALQYAQTVLLERIVADFSRLLRDRLFEAMIMAKWLGANRARRSDTTYVISHEIGRVAHATQQQLTLIGSLFLTIVHLSVAFYLSPSFTVLTLLCIGVLALAMRPVDRDVSRLGSLLGDNWRNVYATLHDNVSGIRVSKIFGLEEVHMERFNALNDRLVDERLQHARAKGRALSFQSLGGGVALGCFVFVGIRILSIPLAELLVLIYLFSRLLPRFSSMHQCWQRVLHAIPSYESYRRQFDAFDRAKEPALPISVTRLDVQSHVELRSVTHVYEGGTPALQGVDLLIPARTTTAIVGRSGAGKSTLADILIGLLQPTSGHVLVDGKPLSGERLHAWRRSIGYVPQDTFLFHETIRANLQFADANVADSVLWQALEATAASDFVMALPDGIDTVVGDDGARLSGGERQRIALARALIRRPSFLILDEATSHLDSENETHIKKAIDGLRRSLTLVVIAHSLSTVRHADKIVVLHEGRIVDSGPWDELVSSKRPYFRNMLQAASGMLAIVPSQGGE